MTTRYFKNLRLILGATIGAYFVANAVGVCAQTEPTVDIQQVGAVFVKTKPYGTRDFNSIEPVAFQANIISQLQGHGFSPDKNKITLFPDSPPKNPGTYNFVDGTITGTQTNYLQFFVGNYNAPIFANLPTCKDGAMSKYNGRAAQIFNALHETAHYVDHQSGWLSSKVLAKLEDHADHEYREFGNPKPLLDQENIRERLADTAAALYIMSNFENQNELKEFILFKAASRGAYPQPAHYHYFDHDTMSSTMAGIKAFNKNQRLGISIVEATQWAAEIIAKQPLRDLDLTSRKAFALQNALLSHDPFAVVMAQTLIRIDHVDLRSQRSAYQQAVKARARVCGQH